MLSSVSRFLCAAAVVCLCIILKVAVRAAGTAEAGRDRGNGGHDKACLPSCCSTQEPKLLMVP